MALIVPIGISLLAIGMIVVGVALVVRNRGADDDGARHDTVRQSGNDPALTGVLSIVVGAMSLLFLLVGMMAKH